jgi:pimeloyl-ACP methyl ester carboxylesterase
MDWSARQYRSGSSERARAARLAELAAQAWQPAAEFGQLLSDPVFWGFGVPRGDGHPVMVLPGLGAGDRYLTPLRGWLRRIGYSTVRSGIDRNPGWSEELVEELGRRAVQAFQRDGRQVTIIGHSMGGLLGRSVGVRHPEAVRHVITLGAPLALSRSTLPPSVRLTALHSRADRIVRHPNALSRDPHARNIEVQGSHTGMAGNVEVYRHLGRLLREAVGSRQ